MTEIYIIFQVLINQLWSKESLKEATDAPVHVDSKITVKFEPAFLKGYYWLLAILQTTA